MNDLTALRNIDQALIKLTEYTKMTEDEQKEFFKPIFIGLATRIINDGQGLVKDELLMKLKDKPSENTLKRFFEELAENEESGSIFAKRLVEALEEILAPVIDKLNPAQKSEIHAILTAEN